MRVWITQLVRSAREMRRIDHRQNDVDLVDEHFPPLSDSHISRVGGREPEHVGGNPNSSRLQQAAHKPELVANHLSAYSPVREWVDGLAHETFFVRESHVVELHFAEAQVVRLTREIG